MKPLSNPARVFWTFVAGLAAIPAIAFVALITMIMINAIIKVIPHSWF